MARGTNHSKIRSETRCAIKPGVRSDKAAAQDRRWQRGAVIGTWLDSLARIVKVLTKIR